MEYAADVPFFQRNEVIAAIDSISRTHHLVLYAGAGVTIDRSGLTWNALIEGLLEPHVADHKSATEFVTSEGALFAASAAHHLYEQANDEENAYLRNIDTRQRMVDALRVQLYSPGTWRTGDLAPSIADAAYVWNMPVVGDRARARSAFIVTTNYDDYIYQAVRTAYDNRRSGLAYAEISPTLPIPALLFPTQNDPLIVPSAKAIYSHPKRTAASSSDSLVPCLHLHGYIPRNPYQYRDGGLEDQSVHSRFPVVSENDYYDTAAFSQRALTELFRHNSLVIAGASVTDPPLIRALEATKSSAEKHPRWVLVPLVPKAGSEDVTAFFERKRLIQSRLESLGLRPIFFDFYAQLAQFFREIVIAATSDSKIKYGTPEDDRSYYTRMGEWWTELQVDAEDTRIALQSACHDYLTYTLLPELQETLGAHADERMKIELWLRWNPRERRELRLFASSMGIWTNSEAMRITQILHRSNDLVMRAFTSGRPELADREFDMLQLQDLGRSAPTRWQSALAVPVWTHDHEQESQFITGVFLLSSMTESSSGALSESRNRSKIAETVRQLLAAGELLTDPKSYDRT